MPLHALAPRPAVHRDKQIRHHEVDVEPHAHPGDPRQVIVTEREYGVHQDPSPLAPQPKRPSREPHP